MKIERWNAGLQVFLISANIYVSQFDSTIQNDYTHEPHDNQIRIEEKMEVTKHLQEKEALADMLEMATDGIENFLDAQEKHDKAEEEFERSQSLSVSYGNGPPKTRQDIDKSHEEHNLEKDSKSMKSHEEGIENQRNNRNNMSNSEYIKDSEKQTRNQDDNNREQRMATPDRSLERIRPERERPERARPERNRKSMELAYER